MRRTTKLGLAMVMAMASMAFIGASSASAEGSTALCKVHTDLACPEGEVYLDGVLVLAELVPQTNFVLLGPNLLTEVSCTHSHWSAKITTPGGLSEPGVKLEGDFENLSFGGCTHKTGVGCNISVEQLGTLLLLKTGVNHGNGLVHEVLFRVVCALVMNCVYTTDELPTLALGATLPLTSTPTSLAKLHFNHALLTEEIATNPLRVGCPNEGFFDASYAVQTPHDVFITH